MKRQENCSRWKRWLLGDGLATFETLSVVLDVIEEPACIDACRAGFNLPAKHSHSTLLPIENKLSVLPKNRCQMIG